MFENFSQKELNELVDHLREEVEKRDRSLEEMHRGILHVEEDDLVEEGDRVEAEDSREKKELKDLIDHLQEEVVKRDRLLEEMRSGKSLI